MPARAAASTQEQRDREAGHLAARRVTSATRPGREHLGDVLDVVGRARDEAADRIAVEEAEVQALRCARRRRGAGRASRPGRSPPSAASCAYSSARADRARRRGSSERRATSSGETAGRRRERSGRAARRRPAGAAPFARMTAVEAGLEDPGRRQLEQRTAATTRPSVASDLRAVRARRSARAARAGAGRWPCRAPPLRGSARGPRGAPAPAALTLSAPPPRRARGSRAAPPPPGSSREPRVEPAARDELGVAALLDEPALVEHHDLVGVAHGARRATPPRPRCARGTPRAGRAGSPPRSRRRPPRACRRGSGCSGRARARARARCAGAGRPRASRRARPTIVS